MSGSITPRLSLPYMVVGQAQKELAHSQGIARLDAIVQAVVQTVGTLNAPPGSPAEGQGWIVGASPTGAWSGQANNLAYYINASWIFIAKFTGMEVRNLGDGGRYFWDGSSWVIAANSLLGARDTIPPVVSSWTWVNQGGSTATDRNYGISLVSPADTTANLRGLVRSTPTAPYSAAARMESVFFRKNYHGFGMWWRQSSDGKLHLFEVVFDTNGVRLVVERWTNETTYSSQDFNGSAADLMVSAGTRMRLRDDNTDRFFELSPDGDTWISCFSLTRTTWITPDQVGFFVRGHNQGTPNLQAAVTLFSWAVS